MKGRTCSDLLAWKEWRQAYSTSYRYTLAHRPTQQSSPFQKNSYLASYLSDTSELFHNFRSLSWWSVLFRLLHSIDVCSTFYFLLCCLRTSYCLLPFSSRDNCSKPHPFSKQFQSSLKLRRDKLIELLMLKNREMGIMFLTEEY